MYLAAGICILLAAGAVAVDALVETDREQVASGVASVVAAFERGDEKQLLDHFAARALCERLLAQWAVQVVTVEQPLSLKDIQVELHGEGSLAISTFRVNGRVAVRGRSAGHQPSQWRVTWQQQAGEWKIIRLQELDPLRSEPLERLQQIGAHVCP